MKRCFCVCGVVWVLLLLLMEIRCQDLPYVVNLDNSCMRCLCFAATKCDLTLNCDQGYCGPFKISKLYWKDAGELTLPDDDRDREGAYQDCAISIQCAQKVVTNYIIKYGRDCNDDGVTDCDDYAMINFNGGYQCHPELNRTEAGRAWLERYRLCRPEIPNFK